VVICVARKPKLTPELIKEFCTCISNGLTNKDACMICDISEVTLYDWINKAENGGLYAELTKSMKKAEAQFKAFHLQNVTKAGKTSWQASAWMLERKFKREFGRFENAGSGEGVEDLTPLYDALKDDENDGK
jgi:transposase